ncbi:ISKra4 family transposase, partial [Escherichia coli]|nr:ISKra4 family transposase [Escherichia coli]
AIDNACGYLADRTRTRMLRYQDALRDGLPIATGVIEGACRYVVKDRMDRTGARWSLTGAEAVLRLRAIRASKDF